MVDGILVYPGLVKESVLRAFLVDIPALEKDWNPALPTLPYR